MRETRRGVAQHAPRSCRPCAASRARRWRARPRASRALPVEMARLAGIGRGSAGPAAARAQSRATASVRQMKTERRAPRLKAVWKLTTGRPGRRRARRASGDERREAAGDDDAAAAHQEVAERHAPRRRPVAEVEVWRGGRRRDWRRARARSAAGGGTTPGAGERHDEQHDATARMGEPGEQRGDQGEDQHGSCGERAEQLARTIASSHRAEAVEDQVERQQHQAEPDRDPAEVARRSGRGAEAMTHADQDEDRREPAAIVEGEHLGDQASCRHRRRA